MFLSITKVPAAPAIRTPDIFGDRRLTHLAATGRVTGLRFNLQVPIANLSQIC